MQDIHISNTENVDLGGKTWRQYVLPEIYSEIQWRRKAMSAFSTKHCTDNVINRWVEFLELALICKKKYFPFFFRKFWILFIGLNLIGHTEYKITVN